MQKIKRLKRKKKKAFDKNKLSEGFSKHGWFFWSYPFIMIMVYLILGILAGPLGWSAGWIVLLTIPIFYSAVYAMKKKNPMLFAYPFVAAIIFLIFGFLFQLWHPMWIVFLTIPIYYIVAFGKRKTNR